MPRSILVPTNVSSFTTGQMPAQQVAAARVRARKTGRWIVQAGPTGFSALVSPTGDVIAHTDLGARQVLSGRVALRTGRTLFVRFGDAPLLLAALVVLALGRRVVAAPVAPGRGDGCSRAYAVCRGR